MLVAQEIRVRSEATFECVATTIDRDMLRSLLETGFRRREQAVRLLGAGVRLGEEEEPGTQLSLFGLENPLISFKSAHIGSYQLFMS